LIGGHPENRNTLGMSIFSGILSSSYAVLSVITWLPTKAAVKKAAVKTPTAKTAKKSVPIRKAAKKAAAKKTAPAPVQTATTPAAEVSVGK
jgi:hypothetical protein